MHKNILDLREPIEKLHKVIQAYSCIVEYAENEVRTVDPIYSVLAIQKILKSYDLIFQLKLFEAKPLDENEAASV